MNNFSSHYNTALLVLNVAEKPEQASRVTSVSPDKPTEKTVVCYLSGVSSFLRSLKCSCSAGSTVHRVDVVAVRLRALHGARSRPHRHFRRGRRQVSRAVICLTDHSLVCGICLQVRGPFSFRSASYDLFWYTHRLYVVLYGFAIVHGLRCVRNQTITYKALVCFCGAELKSGD